ncbi:hypothetical protein N7495_001103 [Penicillium taxi]|uniref:uncharacterized protein n=1 Tax=Penicillium taxi TaxID=168475 RepID=UPI0025455215|nr:uncharacterized protein N7495_001103 [Penicillium taxi]KAJ5908421.1 hypothetical protein N7495_001103 [Penicillium taxi]
MLLACPALLTTSLLQILAFATASTVDKTPLRTIPRIEFEKISTETTNYTWDDSPPKFKHKASRITKRGSKWKEIRQYEAVEELTFVSWPSGTSESAREDDEELDYVFLNAAGSGVTVYVHDSGINLQHEEFTTSAPSGVQKGTIELLYPKTGPGVTTEDLNAIKKAGDTDGHGTCVASKIVGQNWGVAKGANLKFVPLIDSGYDDTIQAGLKAIIEDIKKEREKNARYMAVVNLSYGLKEYDQTAKQRSEYLDLYKQIYDLDAVMVTTAGNYLASCDEPREVNDYPALFVKELPNMIVVGSVDVDGSVSEISKIGNLVSVYAPGAVNSRRGEGITCAWGNIEGSTEDEVKRGINRDQGTSFAAGIVSGLAAYLVSTDPESFRTGKVAEEVKAKILNLAWGRPKGKGFKSVWNGRDGFA